jgi:hypothetical protein
VIYVGVFMKAFIDVVAHEACGYDGAVVLPDWRFT